MELKISVKIIIALILQYDQVHAGNFYSFVKRNVPLSGIIKTIPGVTRRVCVLKCRMSNKCGYSAMDTESDDCLHLSTLNIKGDEKTLIVNLFEETLTDLKVPGKWKFKTEHALFGSPYLLSTNLQGCKKKRNEEKKFTRSTTIKYKLLKYTQQIFSVRVNNNHCEQNNFCLFFTYILALDAKTFRQVKGACSVIPFKGHAPLNEGAFLSTIRW